MVDFIPSESVCDERQEIILESSSGGESAASSTLEATNWDLVFNSCLLFYYL